MHISNVYTIIRFVCYVCYAMIHAYKSNTPCKGRQRCEMSSDILPWAFETQAPRARLLGSTARFGRSPGANTLGKPGHRLGLPWAPTHRNMFGFF